ncbi:hypothetical protein BS47DRAFT_1363293 [Hydnum rufescens UP504]|uniref:Uncharacterized protein n=1 Tax=Hydnum rufescens UP504 TaxID=1448309 RepID=A0A9P6AUN2_9AGAM|nr:hypothetical protein BS47DRAFT_1363293 [Hydnum rufescens UP504]
MELEKQYTRGGTSPVALDNTLGVIFVGIMVSASLFGILTTQCYYYALRFKQDPGWLKCVVAALWIIDAIHQIAASALIFQYTVGLILALSRAPLWQFRISSTQQLARLATASVYSPNVLYASFVSRQPKALAPSRAYCDTFSCRFCSGRRYTLPFLAEAKKYTGLVTLGLVTCAVCDIAVTVPVAWALYSSRTGFKHSFALLDAITFIAQNRSLIHLSANIGEHDQRA